MKKKKKKFFFFFSPKKLGKGLKSPGFFFNFFKDFKTKTQKDLKPLVGFIHLGFFKCFLKFFPFP